MKFTLSRPSGQLFEFYADWRHTVFSGSPGGFTLPYTYRIVKAITGVTTCRLIPVIDGEVQHDLIPIGVGDAACSAKEPGGFNRCRGRFESLRSAMSSAGFGKRERAKLCVQFLDKWPANTWKHKQGRR